MTDESPDRSTFGWITAERVTAVGAMLAVGVALVAVLLAWKTSDRQAQISERLLTIEDERDHARLQVLPNLYRGRGEASAAGLPVLVTVANIGSAVGGPVSVSIANRAGRDLSHMMSDPVLLEPGGRVTIAVYAGRPGETLESAFPYDLGRQARSDFPEGPWGKGEFIPARLADGYFIRAWDPTTERSWWYPEEPQQEPREPPIIS